MGRKPQSRPHGIRLIPCVELDITRQRETAGPQGAAQKGWDLVDPQGADVGVHQPPVLSVDERAVQHRAVPVVGGQRLGRGDIAGCLGALHRKAIGPAPARDLITCAIVVRGRFNCRYLPVRPQLAAAVMVAIKRDRAEFQRQIHSD